MENKKSLKTTIGSSSGTITNKDTKVVSARTWRGEQERSIQPEVKQKVSAKGTSGQSNKASTGSASRAMTARKQRNLIGNSNQETAETVRNTIENYEAVGSEGQQEHVGVESIRDFPQDGELTAYMHAFVVFGQQLKRPSVASSQTMENFKSSGSQSIQRSGAASERNIQQIQPSPNPLPMSKAQKVAIQQKKAKDILERMQSNTYGYKFIGLISNKYPSYEQGHRSRDWNKLALANQALQKQPMLHAEKKTQITNQTFQEPEVETSVQHSGFADTLKLKAFQTRNESSINRLQSFRTLDFTKKDDEYSLLGMSRGNIGLAQALNRESSLDSHSYGKQQRGVVPSEYISFKDKDQIIRGLNNPVVQAARLRNSRSGSQSSDQRV